MGTSDRPTHELARRFCNNKEVPVVHTLSNHLTGLYKLRLRACLSHSIKVDSLIAYMPMIMVLTESLKELNQGHVTQCTSHKPPHTLTDSSEINIDVGWIFSESVYSNLKGNKMI